jgi:hypothetical protein
MVRGKNAPATQGVRLDRLDDQFSQINEMVREINPYSAWHCSYR